MINYHNKRFRPLENTENAETGTDTIFHYKQEGNLLTAAYAGGKIRKGHLIGLVDDSGTIEMRYHQINTEGKLMTGICSSTPKIDADGKIRLYEHWEWTSGDRTKGKSVLIEL